MHCENLSSLSNVSNSLHQTRTLVGLGFECREYPLRKQKKSPVRSPDLHVLCFQGFRGCVAPLQIFLVPPFRIWERRERERLLKPRRKERQMEKRERKFDRKVAFIFQICPFFALGGRIILDDTTAPSPEADNAPVIFWVKQGCVV